MTGIFNKRPPRPKYSCIWDVETVLQYFGSLPNNQLLSDKLLTLKLTMLLELTAASRASEITGLSIDNMQRLSDAYVFPHHEVVKNKT